MKRPIAFLLTAACAVPTTAAEAVLDAAARQRARSLPHYATSGVRFPDGSVRYGTLVVAAYDDGRVRVEFSASDASGDTVTGEMALASPSVASDGSLRSAHRSPDGPAARYANHGTLAVPGRGRSIRVDASDLRMDPDGLFALSLTGVDPAGATLPLEVFGRVLGTCWANDGGTLKRVADLSTRPDCLRLFGHL